MNLQFTQEELYFQKEVRDWIKSNYPEEMKRRYMNSPNGHLTRQEQINWQQALHSRGWSGINWPKQYGGADFSASKKYLFNNLLAESKLLSYKNDIIKDSNIFLSFLFAFL